VKDNHNSEKLFVTYEKKVVGLLSYDEGEFCFSYNKDWTESKKSFPVNFNMPLSSSYYSGDIVKNFFSGLLPEGGMLGAISHREHLSEGNTFGLIKAIGGDCSGALSIYDNTTINCPFESIKKELTLSDLDSYIENMDNFPLLSLGQDSRSLLAGVNQKFPVLIEEKKAYLLSGNLVSTHIIKPEPKNTQYLALNEFTCMSIAKNIGINVPNVDLVIGENHISFMIQRYDRILDKNGRNRKIHQVDLGQACNIDPKLKYEHEGGASVGDCFKIMDNHNINSKESIIEWIAYNFLISNYDAHSKNLSFLLRCNGDHKLAPHFDMVCMGAYPELSNMMSMSIGGEFVPENVSMHNWKELFKSAGIDENKGFDIIRNITERFENEYPLTIKEIKNKYEEMTDISFLDDIEDKFEYKTQLIKTSISNDCLVAHGLR